MSVTGAAGKQSWVTSRVTSAAEGVGCICITSALDLISVNLQVQYETNQAIINVKTII